MNREQAPADHGATWSEPKATAVLVLADGTVIEGTGIGAVGETSGEVCFNTAMTGYQEVLTDPSYAGQIVTFTFPHIGNTGTNEHDTETVNQSASAGVKGAVIGAEIGDASNWRANREFGQWLADHGIIAITGVDTRALAVRIRDRGMTNAVIAHDPDGRFDLDRLRREAAAVPTMEGVDLVPGVTSAESFDWDEAAWTWEGGYRRMGAGKRRIVAVDYGLKRNILRLLVEEDCEVIVVPATATSEEIMALRPDGVFLSNGPGDPAATGEYAAPVIRDILEKQIPTFGICFGHQLLGLAIGARTVKMHQGHHGANHPVKDVATGKVEITSMNHSFAVDSATLPANAEETHISLFDGSNCGLRLTDRPAFSVQYHPEASPGPQDSFYLFRRFIDLVDEHKIRAD